jgi:hypothetical protein
MSNDLLIKINADAKNAQKAYDDLRSQTEDLEKQLSKISQVGAVVFAAFTAEIFFSVRAFNEAEAASTQLTNALQNQGIYSDELKQKYDGLADAVAAKTGLDDDAITKAQAVAQSYLGQTEITLGLTEAIADLAAAEGGDLNSAAEKIAKTISTGTNAFARQGLVLDETATKAEKMARVLEFVSTRAGGLAEEFNKADGYTKALGNAFGNLQESIGSKFAPVVAAANQALANLFNFISSNPVITDLIASFITAGVVVGGLAAAIPAIIIGFQALTAAAATFGIAINASFILVTAGVAVAVAAVTFFALNWERTLGVVKGVVNGFATFVVEAFEGIAKVLQGVFTLDTDKLDEGVQQLKASLRAGLDAGKAVYAEETADIVAKELKQNEAKKTAAAETLRIEQEKQANLQAIRTAELELLRLQNENASAEMIALKSKELETLRALAQENSAAENALLQQRLENNRAMQEQQNAEDLERINSFSIVKQETETELAAQGAQVTAQIGAARIAQLQAQVKTEKDIDRQVQEEILKKRIEGRNAELLDRKKYGVAVALINKTLATEEVQGVKTAAGELVALQNSKNAELKAIGKAAAVAQIIIGTSESAMNIYRGFSTIPIVGPALGIAGAAAAIAFGAERIGQVTSAATGGLIEGGTPGIDSVPAMLMPGELVVPKKNFNDVVGAVQGGGNNNPELLEEIKNMNSKMDGMGTYVFNGDITTDESFVDNFVKKISDAVEFRNAKIFSLNTGTT